MQICLGTFIFQNYLIRFDSEGFVYESRILSYNCYLEVQREVKFWLGGTQVSKGWETVLQTNGIAMFVNKVKFDITFNIIISCDLKTKGQTSLLNHLNTILMMAGCKFIKVIWNFELLLSNIIYWYFLIFLNLKVNESKK